MNFPGCLLYSNWGALTAAPNLTGFGNDIVNPEINITVNDREELFYLLTEYALADRLQV